MAGEELGFCASFQKWMIFVINFILFIFGAIQIGIAGYVLAAGSDSLGFAADVLDGNDTAVKAMLAFGIIVVFISFQGCMGAKRKSKCLLWIYAVILFFMIMGQAMTVAVVAVSLEYGEEIFESLWKELEADTIDDIEVTYECCSFNGDNANDTWAGDVTEYDQCVSDNSFDPMVTCWGKFEKTIDDNYDMVKIITAIVLGVQTLIYFCTHYLIQSIAEAEGTEKGNDIELPGGNMCV